MVKREVVGVSHLPVGSAEVCIIVCGDEDPSYDCGAGGAEPVGYPCMRRRDVGRREHFFSGTSNSSRGSAAGVAHAQPLVERQAHSDDDPAFSWRAGPCSLPRMDVSGRG